MFEMRLRARRLTHGVKLQAGLYAAMRRAAALSCGACLLAAALCFIYGTGAVFGGAAAFAFSESKGLSNAVPWALAALGALLAVFCFALRFANGALFYRCVNREERAPVSFLSVKSGARALYCAALTAYRKALWLLLAVSPGLVTFWAVLLLLNTAGLSRGVLAAGLGLSAAQLLAGAAAAFVLWQRYLPAAYLLYLNPLLSVPEAIRSAALLTRGRLLHTAACRAQTLPWRVLGLFWPARPFVRTYVGLLDALLCEALYTQNEKI